VDDQYHPVGSLSSKLPIVARLLNSSFSSPRSGTRQIVTSGVGRVQKSGGAIEEIRPGDVVWFEPDEKHWHGAGPTVAMTHIAIQDALNGKVVDWMEKVSDEQYNGQRT